MAGILAIESDRKRQDLLTTLVREHVRADLTIVDSVTAAIDSFTERSPDLILAPTLLSPRDSDQLISHVRTHAAPCVQMLTIPALDMLIDAPQEEKRGFGLFKRRRPVSLGLQYDPGVVGMQIADRLERGRTLRAEQETAAAARPARPDVALASRQRSKHADQRTGVEETAHQDRRCSQRTPKRGAPGVWGVRLPWGADVDLVNISRTGLLVESGSKVTPGVTLELHLSGPGLNRVVLARFVRSEVASVDRLGVRYHAAAHFESPIDVLGPRAESAGRSTPQSLADLLARVLNESGPQPEPASIRFARGLRSLIGVRDVLLRHAPIAPVDDSESIYFHVRGEGSAQTILQIVFDRDRALTAGEFKLLKAAASMAAAVLELERPLPMAGSAPDQMYDVA